MKGFSEQMLEEMIFTNAKVIHEKGLPKFHKNLIRQFYLPSGKKIDLFNFEIKEDQLYFTVIELKKEMTDTQALLQAYGYLSEVIGMLKEHFSVIYPKVILIGKDMKYIPVLSALNFEPEIYCYNYSIDGVQFTKVENPYIADPVGTSNLKYHNILCALHYDIIPQVNEQISVVELYKMMKMGCPNLQTVIHSCKALDLPIDQTTDFIKDNNIVFHSKMDYQEVLALLLQFKNRGNP